MQALTVRGNKAALSSLDTALINGRTNHAYIISGPRGSGKRMISYMFAAALVCPDGGKLAFASSAHMYCVSCSKARSGNHPDIITVQPEKDKKQVGVTVIRGLKVDAYIKPNESKRKVYIIPEADDLNASCQNALLAILEEPPAHAVFILIVENVEGLLSTVRSRCVTITMGPVDEESGILALREHFPQKKKGELRDALARSHGLIGGAIALLEKGNGGIYNIMDEFFKALFSKDELQLFTASLPLEKFERERMLSFLEVLSNALAEALVAKKTGRRAEDENIYMLSSALSSRSLSLLYDFVCRLGVMCEGNSNVGILCGYLVSGCYELASGPEAAQRYFKTALYNV